MRVASGRLLLAGASPPSRAAVGERQAAGGVLPTMPGLPVQWPTRAASLRGSAGWWWGSPRACAVHRAGGKGVALPGDVGGDVVQGCLQLQCCPLCLGCLCSGPPAQTH